MNMLMGMADAFDNAFDDEESKGKYKEVRRLREQAMKTGGMAGSNMAKALGMKEHTPYLINIAEDASLTGCLLYYIPKESERSESERDIPITIGSDPNCKICPVHKELCAAIDKPTEGSILESSSIAVTYSV